jgi:ADP-ribosylglycohydrolase
MSKESICMNTCSDKANDFCIAGILGLVVGDALGVPVEFQSREQLIDRPVTGMRSGGTHGQLEGTWSDDTSLTLCLVESICESGIDYHDQGRRFVRWLYEAEWTPHGTVFDVGIATRQAIHRLATGVEPTSAGSTDERSNGNGALMRILPVALYLAFAESQARIEIPMKCSRLTHGHPRSQLACAFFVEIAASLIRGNSPLESITAAQITMAPIIADQFPTEQIVFARLLSPQLASLTDSEMSGSGYVIDCLESSLWCATRATTYQAGVLRAVNLGEDTDTTGAVTGSLLGLCFGANSIPAEWRDQIARRDEVLDLCNRFQNVCQRKWEGNQ